MLAATQCGLAGLSDELVQLITLHLAPVDLAMLARVSRRLAAIVLDNRLWKRLYLSHFALPATRKPILTRSSVSAMCKSASNVLMASKERWKSLYALQTNWTNGRASTTIVPAYPTNTSNDRTAGCCWVVAHGLLLTWSSATIHLHKTASENYNSLLAARNVIVNEVAAYPGVAIKMLVVDSAPYVTTIDSEHSFNESIQLLLLTTDNHFHIVRLNLGQLGDTSVDSLYAHKTSFMVDRRRGADNIVDLVLYDNYILRYTRKGALIVKSIITQHDICCLYAPISHTLASLHIEPTIHAPSLQSSDTIHFTVYIALAHETYTPPSLPPSYTVRIQSLQFANGILVMSDIHTLQSPNDILGPFDHSTWEKQNDSIYEPPVIHSPITLLKFTPPYLMVCHADDSMSVYGFFSRTTNDQSQLTINAGIMSSTPWISQQPRFVCTFLTKLYGHTAQITAVAVSEMGRIVSAARDGSVRVWQLEPWVQSVVVNNDQSSSLSPSTITATTCGNKRKANHLFEDDNTVYRNSKRPTRPNPSAYGQYNESKEEHESNDDTYSPQDNAWVYRARVSHVVSSNICKDKSILKTPPGNYYYSTAVTPTSLLPSPISYVSEPPFTPILSRPDATSSDELTPNTTYFLRHLKPGRMQAHTHTTQSARDVLVDRYTDEGLLLCTDNIQQVFDVYDDHDSVTKPPSPPYSEGAWNYYRGRNTLHKYLVTRIRRDEYISLVNLPTYTDSNELTHRTIVDCLHFDEGAIVCFCGDRIVTFDFGAGLAVS